MIFVMGSLDALSYIYEMVPHFVRIASCGDRGITMGAAEHKNRHLLIF